MFVTNKTSQIQVLLIGLMSLPNQEVFILFHPLVYTAKLNIESKWSYDAYVSLVLCWKRFQEKPRKDHSVYEFPHFMIADSDLSK